MATAPDETYMSRQSFMGCTVHVHFKGGNSQAEMNNANQLEQQQINLQNSQLQMQQGQLNMVNPSLQAIIQNGGMLPAQQAALTSQATTGLAQQYQGLEGQIGQQLVARGITGGANAGGGGIAQSYGALGAAEAGQQANLLQNIQQQKAQGLQGAIQTGLGEASMFGSQAVSAGNQGVGALGSGVTAANNADQASTGFWGSLVGGLAGLGGSLGGAAITKCYVAAELYGGWLAPETVSIRNWLYRTWWMQPFCVIYGAIGQSWAAWIRRNKLARKLTKRLFDAFLGASHGS